MPIQINNLQHNWHTNIIDESSSPCYRRDCLEYKIRFVLLDHTVLRPVLHLPYGVLPTLHHYLIYDSGGSIKRMTQIQQGPRKVVLEIKTIYIFVLHCLVD